MLAAQTPKVTPKSRKGRFRGVSAVARELVLSPGHVWRVLSGERANYATASEIRDAYARWCDANPPSRQLPTS